MHVRTCWAPASVAAATQEKLIFLIVQVLITGINALLGFLLLRGMNKSEYAVYTIVFSLLAIFTNITNMGITPAMSGIGGKIWTDKWKMQALLNTTLKLRNQLSWWFAGPFAVYCIWQFGEAGLHWLTLSVLVFLLLFAAWVQMQSAFYSIVLQLNKAVRPLQKNELWFVLLKFAGVIALLALGSPVILIVGWIGVCLFLNLRVNRDLSARFLEPHTETDSRFQTEINSIIRSNFFRTVYWSLEGQISILLCTLFATTENIADIGALGRLGVYFSIFQAFILNYALPGLAKSQDKAGILRRAKRILSFTIAVILPILGWALLHPWSLLWVLGPHYTALQPQLFFYLLSISVGQVANVLYQICASKAWIQINRFYVPLALPLQIAMIYFLNLSDLSQVILFIGINNLFFLLFNTVMFVYSFNRHLPASALN